MEEQAMVLRHLLVHLEHKEAQEDSEDGLAGEFSRLKMQSIQYRNDNTFPSKAALIKDNVKKNRYKDIVPFDHTRVKLSLNTSKSDEDYINASFIKGVSDSRAYIATQGPLPHTVLDFLRMIWEYKVEVVVMACREFEMGRKKCERYWPETQADQFVCGPFTIDCDYDENKGDYQARKLRITYQNCSRALHQLHYYNWPDHGVPDSIPPIMEMLQEMRICQDHDNVPIVIHCSAGCGRTGALCVIDYTWMLLKRQTLPPDFSIYDLVQHMRTQRPSVVQTKEQYELVYKTVKFLFERYLQSFDSTACQNKVQPAPSPSPAASANEKSDMSQESESDLEPASQCLLYPEPQDPRLTLMEEQMLGPAQLGPSAQEMVSAHSSRDDYHWREGEEAEQQQPQPPHHQRHPSPLELLQRTPEVVTPAQVQDREGHGLRLISRAREEERHEPEDSEPPPKPTMLRLATACLMVEDPYFGSPDRTSFLAEPPEYLMEDLVSCHAPTLALNDRSLALDLPCSGHSLQVIIPPNAAALAISEMGGTGSPPSPVPPLPERTPESYELAHDEALLEQFTSGHPVGQNRVGMSSEWSCDSLRPPATQHEINSWTRSKSLKVSMTSSAARSNMSSSHLPPPPPPPPVQPELDFLLQEGMNPPLPHRTPESFILATEEVDENPGSLLQVSDPGPRIGISSEWAGSPQPKKLLDFVFMTRSKSVRAKSSRQVLLPRAQEIVNPALSEPFAVVRQLAPPSVVFSRAGSGVEQHVDSVSSESSENKTVHTNNGKVMPRTRSLKFFRSRGKSKPAAPPVTPPPSANGTSSSGFKFGFGNRFAKPKGPRSYPEPWI